MEKKHNRRLHPARRSLGLLFGALCLYLAFRGVDRSALLRAIGSASIPLLLAAGACSILTSAVKCVKLGILLRAVRKLRYRVLFAAETISILVDIAFPLRLQELVRAYIIGRGERMAVVFVLGAEAIEKCVELPCLLGILFALSIVHPLPAGPILWIRLGAAGAVALGAFLAVIVTRPDRIDRAVGRIRPIRFPGAARLCRALDQLLDGIRAAAIRPAALLQVLLVTLVEWSLLAATLWTAARAVGVSLTAPQLLGVIAFNMIAFAVPASTAGSVGIYELAGTATLVLVFGFSREQALAVTLALHVVMVGFGALGGLAGLHIAHLTLGEVSRLLPRGNRVPPTGR